MIVARISRTITYSTFGRVRRLSQTHSTMKARPMNTSTPPTMIRGINSTTAAPNTTAASGTSAATRPANRALTLMRSASAVRLSAWYPGMPPRAPETTLSTPASRSSWFESRSRRRTTSLPLTLNSIASTATNTAVAIPVHCPSTAPQSAPLNARTVHGCHSRADSNGPSSHRPSFAVSIVEPVTSMPTTNSTSPMPRTAGITSGRRTTRVATSRTTPKTNAGPQRTSSCSRVRSPIVRRYGTMPEET